MVRPRETFAALADTHPRKCLSPARALWGCKDKPCKHRTPEVPAPSERSADREMLNPADLQLPQARVCDKISGGLAKLNVTSIHHPPMPCIRPKIDCSGTDPPPPVRCSRICGPPKWIALTQTNPSHRACAWTGTLHRKQLRRLTAALLLGQRLIRAVCAENGLRGIFPLLGPHSGEECCCPYSGLRSRRSILFEVCVLPQMFEVMSTRAAHR